MAKFKPGQSGNPDGRPKGVPDRRTVYREALADRAPEIITTLIEKALDGDSTALRLCADRIVPTLKATDASINITLSGSLAEQGRQVLEGLGDGTLSPNEASTAMGILQTQSKLVESDEIIDRIEQLERRNDQGR